MSNIASLLNKGFLDIQEITEYPCKRVWDIKRCGYLIISLCTSHETKMMCYFQELHFFWKIICSCFVNLLCKYSTDFYKNWALTCFSRIRDQSFNTIMAFMNAYIWHHQQKCTVFSCCNLKYKWPAIPYRQSPVILRLLESPPPET